MDKIGIFTSGGDAPGMNACIRASVRACIFHKLEPYGILRGYNGMIHDEIFKMNSRSVGNIIQRGGTILKSARSNEFHSAEMRQKAYKNLKSRGIQGLIAIGGNGTFTGAEIFHNEFDFPVVGAPGTIDNDLYGTDLTIGFDTAVNTALEAIDKIRDTASSHERIFFVEVMGRDSGYIAVYTGIGGGAEIILVPETLTSIQEVSDALKEGWKRDKTSSIVVVAEGDEEGGSLEVSAKVKKAMGDLDYRISILGHIQRGGRPTATDRLIASRMGIGAVEGLLNGNSHHMVGICNNELKFTPFEEAIDKKKPIHPDLLKMNEILSI
jgi:6-phosphofructokinase 1